MNHLEFIQSKIIPDIATLEKHLAFWNFRNYHIVFTNGCFDILHRGHIEYLSKAADLADLLFVGINTDASVKKLKGNSRPIFDEQSRLLQIASLNCVSVVMLFDEETPYELIKKIQPDILVKGGDYITSNIVGADIVSAKGGKVETIPFVEGYSSTTIIEKLKNL